MSAIGNVSHNHFIVLNVLTLPRLIANYSHIFQDNTNYFFHRNQKQAAGCCAYACVFWFCELLTTGPARPHVGETFYTSAVHHMSSNLSAIPTVRICINLLYESFHVFGDNTNIMTHKRGKRVGLVLCSIYTCGRAHIHTSQLWEHKSIYRIFVY